MYSYEVAGIPPMTRVYSDGTLIDESGPWIDESAAESWASLYVNKLNEGLATPEEPT